MAVPVRKEVVSTTPVAEQSGSVALQKKRTPYDKTCITASENKDCQIYCINKYFTHKCLNTTLSNNCKYKM